MSDEKKLEQQAAEAKQEVKDEELEKVTGGVFAEFIPDNDDSFLMPNLVTPKKFKK